MVSGLIRQTRTTDGIEGDQVIVFLSTTGDLFVNRIQEWWSPNSGRSTTRWLPAPLKGSDNLERQGKALVSLRLNSGVPCSSFARTRQKMEINQMDVKKDAIAGYKHINIMANEMKDI